MGKLKIWKTIQSKLSSLGKTEEQFIIVKDSKDLYIDVNGERIHITDFIEIEDDPERLAVLSPITNKFYYVRNNNKLWRYVNSDWSCLDTWRGIQDNLTSDSAIESLSAKQGKILNEKFNDYLPLTGGKVTGDIITSRLKSTYLHTSGANNLSHSPDKILVLDEVGWLYYRTPTQILADIDASPKEHTHNYLPISGGTMDTDANIVAKVSNDNRTTTLTGSGIRLKPPTTNLAAFGLAYYDNNTPQNLIGGIGAYAQNNEVEYYYIGGWQNPLLRVSKSGAVSATGNINSFSHNFLLRYGNTSTKVVAVKLGSFTSGYDTKATIDIVGRNLYNGKQAGSKYTLVISFNSNVSGGFPTGGVLYYYGAFTGNTGIADTTANKIDIQLVQNKENSSLCDVYMLLNEPANYFCYKIDVSCPSELTWVRNEQWITSADDIPEANGTTSYVVTRKEIALTESTVSKAIADKNGNDITETYMKINDAQKQAYDTGRIWLNGEPIMRQDYCVAIKKGSTTWNDGCVLFNDIINDSNLTSSNSMYTGILDWSAFGTYTDEISNTYDINTVDVAKVEVYTDNDGLVYSAASFDNNDNVPYEYIVIVGYIEYVRNGNNIPKNMVKIIDD